MHFLAHRPGARLLAALAPLLALCACATQRPEARQWRTLRAEGFTVYHAAGLGRDGRYVERLAADAFARLTETFGGNTKTSLGTLAIYVHAQPTADADVGRAMLRTARRSSALEAELHLLAPSLHPPDTATVVGLRFDDAYFAKLLTHEISTLFLETVTEEKSSGWTLYDAPSWFVQGYEEYLGLTLASVDTARIWKRYRQWAVAASPPLDIAAGARNDYIDGALLVEFLHARYGAAAVRALLESPAPTFWEAFRQTFGSDAKGLERGFGIWLRERR